MDKIGGGEMAGGSSVALCSTRKWALGWGFESGHSVKDVLVE